jgi:hypothetical protein
METSAMRRHVGAVLGLLALCGAIACDGGDSGDDDTGATAATSDGSATSSATSSAESAEASSSGGSSETPCTMTWSGAAMGTADCTDSASSIFLGVMTQPTVVWMVIGETTDHSASFGFTLAKPPTATTYEGTTADDQFCTASVTSADFLSNWSADSKSPATGTSCSITLTSVVDDSSGASSTFIVHGTATATLVKGDDPATVTLDVTF